MEFEKPIIFSSAMVKAIQDGRKTQTRRVIKFPSHICQLDAAWVASVNPDGQGNWIAWGPKPVTDDFSRKTYPNGGGFRCPYGQPGEYLWVREKWSTEAKYDILRPSQLSMAAFVFYGALVFYGDDSLASGGKSRPSIFMPRWASRITLKIIDLRAEKLQAITETDALDEGALSRADFMQTWDSINKKRGFDSESDPWVWVITFTLWEVKG